MVEHAAEDDEEPADAEIGKKAGAGSRTWVAGAIGMVLGSAASIGLMMFNLLPFVGGSNDQPAARPSPPVTAASPSIAPAPLCL